MKIALIHDQLTQEGGAERVLKVLHDIYPKAPIYTLVYNQDKLGKFFHNAKIKTSFLQKIPGAKSKYQWLLPLMPTATESYDLSEYDVIISSSSAFSKGVITKSTALHICYCHTPTRYLWMDTHEYVRNLHTPGIIKTVLPFILNRLRQWDRHAADRVDKYIANSKTVQERIKKYYKQESKVIYPPVDTNQFYIADKTENYFLAGGRLVAYKRFDLVVEAFSRLGIPLKLFGEGPEYKNLKKNARKNIEFLGKVSDKEKADLYAYAKAYIHPQEEDCGITQIEAMASGRPVIALAAGGALETVVDRVTGVLFYDQDWAAIANAVLKFDSTQFNPQEIRQHAMKFSEEQFTTQMQQFVTRSWQEWKEHQHIRRLREMKMLF